MLHLFDKKIKEVKTNTDDKVCNANAESVSFKEHLNQFDKSIDELTELLNQKHIHTYTPPPDANTPNLFVADK